MFKLKSKLILAVIVIFGITAFMSCDKTDNESQKNTNSSEEQFNGKQLVPELFSVGVSELSLLNENDISKTFSINASVNNYDGYEISFSDSLLTMEKSNDFIDVYFSNSKYITFRKYFNSAVPTVILKNNEIILSELSMDKLDSLSISQIGMLGIFSYNFLQNSDNKITLKQYEQETNLDKSINDWYVYVGFGLGRSDAYDDVHNHTKPYCALVCDCGDINVSCIFDNHLCFGTQTMDCN